MKQFIARHELKFRSPRKIEEVSDHCYFVLVVYNITSSYQGRVFTKEQIESWMDSLGSLLDANKFPPSLIFNFDETMCYPGKTRTKVLVRSGSRPLTQIMEKGEHITFGLGIAADGGRVSPLMILPLQTLPGLPPSLLNFFSITGQQSGWITEEIYQQWVKRVFIPYVARRRQELGCSTLRALLLVDGHSSRDNEATTALLERANVDCLVIPAHSSTILQPLDLTVNGVFKTTLAEHWKPIQGEEKDTRRVRLLAVAALALEAAMSTLHVTAGFARAGIYPFNKQVPLNSDLIRNPLLEVGYQRPRKRSRGPRIAGFLLTSGGALQQLLPPVETEVEEIEVLGFGYVPMQPPAV